ncbi:hypothetical protein ACK6D9_14265 [Hoeflea sp. Naph1]|uniref:hypothetical protein n=1 Tax=Hoeflea sp. Naph1 TaxID=3388653 RepID=UPI00398FDCE8
MAGSRAKVEAIGPRLELFIEGRLLGRDTLALEGVPLHHVIDACEFLGRFLSGDDQSHQIGFDALMLADDDLRDRLRLRLLEIVPAEERQRGLYGALGSIVYGRSANEAGSLRPWIERQLLQAFAEVGRIGRKRFRDIEIERREFTLVEAAAKLDVAPKALSRFAKHLGIGHTPWKDAHSFSNEDVIALRDKLAEMISLPETIVITGVPAHEFRFLERAGLIKGHTGLVRGSKGTRYLRSDVVMLVERVCAAAKDDDIDATTLFSYAKQTRQSQGEVMRMVVEGELVPCRLDPKAVGFRRLLFLRGKEPENRR